MNLSIQQCAIIELPESQVFYRVQRKSRRKGSKVIRGMILPPPGILAGRFCLNNGLTAYLGDSPETALYEAIFRRDLRAHVTLDSLCAKELRTYRSNKILRLVDIRGAEEKYPFLHSMRIQHTQEFAHRCFNDGFDGIIYSSAQHPFHECICLFENGAKKMAFVEAMPLVNQGKDQLLRVVVQAALRSAIEIT